MSRKVRLLAGLLSVGLALPGAAQAEAMPQLNFANPLTLGQALWMFVIFLVLYLLCKSWALPQVAQVVEARAASIQADLHTAQQAKHEAEAAVTELMAVTQRAHAEAQAAIDAQVTAARTEAAARAVEANQALDTRLAQAEAQIAAARASAMGALKQVASDTAQSIVERLLGSRPAAGSVDGAVDRALATRQA